ncbi:MAG: potassium transporter Kup [Oligoflexia bacterium]|nr:potassium transporter Kup [Oligoflexia bacterium]
MREPHSTNFSTLMLGALGVVYGDIGTSPLYAFRECFHDSHGILLNSANVMGVLSLITWSLIVMISIKYISFVMRADNKGEGGILALIALVSPHRQRRASDRVRYVIPIGIFGAALLFGDGMITPAISVLSAVEGIEIATPVFSHYVIPATLLILFGLFYFQKFGTAKIGAIFGPIVILWFIVLGLLGIFSILQTPEVLRAVNPMYAIEFFRENGLIGWLVLGSVVLVVTGGEALYADMGHFGRKPIQAAWFLVVLPGLLLNYFGQGALLIRSPEAIQNPFYFLAPSWALIPLVMLSTIATVIASQALISGVFSLTRQAIQLGYIPRLNIIHTSKNEIGQIYIPMINWVLMLSTFWLVITFRSSSNLAAAYGLAVTGTMVTTTILAYFVARRTWGWSRTVAIIVMAAFLICDLAFFSANLIKIPQGGWFPLVVGAVFYFLMATWQKGRAIVAARLKRAAFPIKSFVEDIERKSIVRVPGVSIFMTSDAESTPPALMHNLKHNKIMHEKVVLLSITTYDEPYVRSKERTEFEVLANNFYRIIANYGFMQTPNIFEILDSAKKQGLDFTFDEITFFLGRETILASHHPGMAIWREKVFAFMLRNAQRATAFFQIPADQVIEVGMQVEI